MLSCLDLPSTIGSNKKIFVADRSWREEDNSIFAKQENETYMKDTQYGGSKTHNTVADRRQDQKPLLAKQGEGSKKHISVVDRPWREDHKLNFAQKGAGSHIKDSEYGSKTHNTVADRRQDQKPLLAKQGEGSKKHISVVDRPRREEHKLNLAQKGAGSHIKDSGYGSKKQIQETVRSTKEEGSFSEKQGKGPQIKEDKQGRQGHSDECDKDSMRAKKNQIFIYAEESGKCAEVYNLHRSTVEDMIVCCECKMEVERVWVYLTVKGVPTSKVHGGLEQMQRDEAFHRFKDGNVHVLIITPKLLKLLRGLPNKFELQLVNYDLPVDYGEYKNRMLIAEKVVTFLNQESPRSSLSKLLVDKELDVPDLVQMKLEECRAEIVWGIKPEKEIWDH
nr:PREDICTED: uncharacterized protein LOC108223064 isoform X1 [Daucus carota subsp. sativus]